MVGGLPEGVGVEGTGGKIRTTVIASSINHNKKKRDKILSKNF